MELIIFMVSMLLGFMFFNRINASASNSSTEVPKKCHENDDIHDWSYHPVTKNLTCTKCNYEAYSE